MKKYMEFLEYVKSKIREEGLFSSRYLLSPTFLNAKYNKEQLNEPDEVRKFIVNRNWQYLIITIVVAFVVGVLGRSGLAIFIGSSTFHVDLRMEPAGLAIR